jgi:hypothetical protein
VTAGAAGAGAAGVLATTDGAEPSATDAASAAPPTTAADGDLSPLESVIAFNDAMTAGACDTVDAMSTDALRQEAVAEGGGCAEVAQWIAERGPEDVAEVLPEIQAVRVRLETTDLAVADVTFDVSGPADRTVRRFLLRPEGAGWLFATPDEATEHRPTAASGELDGDVLIFLDADITEDERAAIEVRLLENSAVLAHDYVDHQTSLDEARRLFAGNEVMLQRIAEEPELVPTSFRLVLLQADLTTTSVLVDELAALPGVHESMSANDRPHALPA